MRDSNLDAIVEGARAREEGVKRIELILNTDVSDAEKVEEVGEVLGECKAMCEMVKA